MTNKPIPLSWGLPTAPGWYVFYGDSAPELLNLNPNHWKETGGWNNNFQAINPLGEGWGYTHYHPIPKMENDE